MKTVSPEIELGRILNDNLEANMKLRNAFETAFEELDLDLDAALAVETANVQRTNVGLS